MPTLVQQTTSGEANANTFADVADLVTYADDRGLTIPDDTDDRERLLIKANDYLETLEKDFQGFRSFEDQPVTFPRDNISLHGDIISGEIPTILLNAQCQLAVDIHGGLDLLASSEGREVAEEKVGSLMVKYNTTGDTSPQPKPVKALAILEPLFKNVSAARIIR
jgi:hypothetical protein